MFIQLTLRRLTPEVSGEKTLVLNHSAVEISKVEASVRAHGCINRTESLIRGGQKLALFPDRIRVKFVSVIIGVRERFFG